MQNTPSNPAYPPDNQPRIDQVTATTSIYQVSAMEIVWRNFLAGASRAFGSLVVYALFLFLIFTFVSRTVLPIIMPLLEKGFATLDTLNASQEALFDMNSQSGTIKNTATDQAVMQRVQELYLSTQGKNGSNSNFIYQATPTK